MISIKQIIKRNDLNLILLIISAFFILNIFKLTEFAYTDLFKFFSKSLNIIRFLLVISYLYLLCYYSKSKSEFFLFILFIIFSFVINKKSHTEAIFDLFFIPFFIAKFIDRKVFLKWMMLSCLVFIFLFLTLFLCNYVHDSSEFYRNDEQLRHTFGFVHPNGLGFFTMLCTVLYVLRKNKANLVDFILLLLASAFCYVYPNSITSTLIIFFIAFSLALILFLHKYEFGNRLKYFVLGLSLFIICLILFFTYFITFSDFLKEFLLKMPGSIWARFYLSKASYHSFGFSFFGKYDEYKSILISGINKNSSWSFPIDCAYFFIPIIHGMVTYLFFLGTLIILTVKSALMKEYLYSCVMICVFLYGVSENTIFTATFMPVYVYLFCKR